MYLVRTKRKYRNSDVLIREFSTFYYQKCFEREGNLISVRLYIVLTPKWNAIYQKTWTRGNDLHRWDGPAISDTFPGGAKRGVVC